MSEWNKNKRGGLIKGIDKKRFDILVLVSLNKELDVKEFIVLPKRELTKQRITEGSLLKWQGWPERCNHTIEFKELITKLDGK
jgi:hypothetical protein